MDIIEYSKTRDNQVQDLLGLVKDGTLTVDEAAASLSGWELKNHPWMSQNPHHSHDQQFNKNRCEFDSRLPNFKGLNTDRHL